MIEDWFGVSFDFEGFEYSTNWIWCSKCYFIYNYNKLDWYTMQHLHVEECIKCGGGGGGGGGGLP